MINALISILILIVLVGIIVGINIQYEGLKILRQFRDDLVYTKSDTDSKTISMKQPSEDVSAEQKLEDTKPEPDNDPPKKTGYRSWSEKAADNEVLLPGYENYTTIHKNLHRGIIIRTTKSRGKNKPSEVAYAELIELIDFEEDPENPKQRWKFKVLPIEAYSAVRGVSDPSKDHMVWKSDELRKKYSYVPEDDFQNKYDLKLGG